MSKRTHSLKLSGCLPVFDQDQRRLPPSALQMMRDIIGRLEIIAQEANMTVALATQDKPPTLRTKTNTTMKALVYQGPGRKAFEERPMPKVTAPTDAVVRIVKTTICGTDLHILKGDVATCKPGRILGHEGVGVVDERRRRRYRVSSRRSRSDLVHLGLRPMRVLPQGHVLALHDRRLDSGQRNRRDASGIRAYSARRHQPLPRARRAPRRTRW